MAQLEFARNDSPTLGVEIELQIVDSETLALTSRIEDILAAMPSQHTGTVKPELMQCYLEINTGVCRTVQDAGHDLRQKLQVLDSVVRPMGLELLWAGTHPFSSWRDQKITVDDRYHRLVDLMQDVARRLVTFGLHVHVGVETGDKAILVCERMLKYLPLLLCLSANSPFWEGRNTGLASNRSKIMEGLPTAGLPHQMRNWSEYVWLINHLVSTGFINSIREIWWDIRPHHNFGTVEVRVCDMPANLDQVMAITALVQCLVTAISREIDEGTFQSEYHPMMVQQNKWRATRFGTDARLVRTQDFLPQTVESVTSDLVEKLQNIARELGCQQELTFLKTLPQHAGARQQLKFFSQTGSRKEVVRGILETNHWSKGRLLT